MGTATLAASIMPVNGQQSTGKLGAKSDSKAVKGAFANLLLALQGYAPTEAQSSPGTTTDPKDKTGKDAASNSLLQALIQLLPGRSQSSPGMTQTAGDSGDSGCSGTVPAMSVADFPRSSIRSSIPCRHPATPGRWTKACRRNLASLSQVLQGKQASAGKQAQTTTAGTVDDQATASSSLFKNTDGQAAALLAAVKSAFEPG